MAEVIDIITKLQYEANTSDLSKAYDLLLKHIKAIDENTKSLVELEAIRQKSDNATLDRMRKLEQEIDKLKAKNLELVDSIKKMVKENDNLGKSINDNTKLFNDMAQSRRFFVSEENKATQATQKASVALINFNRVVQDAPYGIIGIANNIDPLILSFQQLQRETGSTTGAFGAMIKGLTGGAGIAIAVSVVTSLLVAFGDKLFNTGEEAEKAAKKQEKYRKEIEDLNKALIESIKLQSELDKLQTDRANKGEAQAKREAELMKARGDEADKIFKKEQEARQKELDDVNRRIKLFEQVREQTQEIFEESQSLSASTLKNQSPQEFREQGILNLLINALSLTPEEAAKIAKNASLSFANRRVIFDMIEKEQVKLNEDVKDIANKIGVATYTFQQEEKERFKKEGEALLKADEERKKETEREYQAALKEVEDKSKINELKNKTLQIIDSMIATEYEIFNLRNQTRAEEGIAISKQQKDAEEKELEFNVGRLDDIRKINEVTLQINRELQKAIIAEQFNREADAVRFQLAGGSLDRQRQGMRVRGTQIDPLGGDSSSQRERLLKDQLFKNRFTGRTTQDELSIPENEIDIGEKLTEKQKKNDQERINSAKQVGQAVIQIAQSVFQRQVELLDMEVSIRQQRVTAATELAKRGNVEVLQAETERLEKAQREREKTAKKQIQINALLQASNSAVAAAQALQVVTNAGATGDPYTTALRIAAAVAALAGGFLAVRTAFADNQPTGFAKGGYTGEGGKYEKAGVVHKGEFVFTKEKTAQYKPVFEAIHTGKYNPYKGGFGDNKKELSAIRRAVEDISINAENRLDGNGLHQVVTTTQKINRRKWN